MSLTSPQFSLDILVRGKPRNSPGRVLEAEATASQEYLGTYPRWRYCIQSYLLADEPGSWAAKEAEAAVRVDGLAANLPKEAFALLPIRRAVDSRRLTAHVGCGTRHVSGKTRSPAGNSCSGWW